MSHEISVAKTYLEDLIVQKELQELQVMKLKYDIREYKAYLNKLKKEDQIQRDLKDNFQSLPIESVTTPQARASKEKQFDKLKQEDQEKDQKLDVKYIDHKKPKKKSNSKKVVKDATK